MDIEAKLKELGITLPEAKVPVANYASYTTHGQLIFISGQISELKGKVGSELTIDEGYEAAKQSAISLLSQLKAAVSGDLSKVKSCIKLGVFVNSVDDFIQQPHVANGASDLVAKVIGKHARAAVSSNSLPLGVAVEVEGIFELN